MKKLSIAVLILFTLTACAFADSLNFSSMTDAELLNAYEEIKLEMESRNISTGAERTLREGKYIIGRDITEGNYVISCTSTDGNVAGDTFGALGNMMDAIDDADNSWGSLYGSLGGLMDEYINMTVEILGDYGDVLHSYEMKVGDSFSITLEEGTALQISSGSCTIKPE